MLNQLSIFGPVLALVALTLVVAIYMYRVRVREIRAQRIDPQKLATRRELGQQLQQSAPADNFINLFEVPVLFYVLCLALYVTNKVTLLQLVLAWVFVAARCLHSYIHCTYNKVMQRFRAYLAGFAVLLAMWVTFAIQLGL
jgi:hypothetical protein